MSDTMNQMKREFEADIIEYKLEPNSIKHSGVEYSNDTRLEDVVYINARQVGEDVRSYNVGTSDYATKKIQPWDIWLEYNLNPWDADIIKRVLRTKDGESRSLDYEKIIHICKERIRQLSLN